MAVIPKPNGPSARLEGSFRLPDGLAANMGGFAPWCAAAFRERAGLAELGRGTPWLVLRRDSALPAEGYRLTVEPMRVTAEAKEERGVIWALTTLSGLLGPGGTAPCCRIEDRPRFPRRGLCLDCARHFFPLPVLKRVIEGMSQAKLNVFHWHLTDDQGWRLESRLVPADGGERYTQAEVRELTEFARMRGVEIVPELDLPGHVSALLAVRPELGCPGRTAARETGSGIRDAALCAGREETYDFLAELLEEVCGLFPGPCVHLGGDEVRGLWWRSCPRCREKMAREGLGSTAALQGYFTSRVSAILEGLGKRPIWWNDVLRSGPGPEGALIQSWTPRYCRQTAAHIRRGGAWLHSDLFALYLDYPHALLPLERVYRSAPADAGGGLLGLEACLWTERTADEETLTARLFPRLPALAEAAWTERLDYGDFLSRLEPRPGWTPREGWDPSGPAARREAAAYLAAFRGENGAPAWPGLPMLGRFITNFGLRAVHFH